MIWMRGLFILDQFSPLPPQIAEATGVCAKSLQHLRGLKSEPGCRKQPLHADFNSVSVLESGDDVLSGLVALDDNTRLYVLIEKDERGMFRPGHTQPVDQNKSVKVEIPKGSIVLWHGTLCHAGADYEEENIRLFFTNAEKNVHNFFCMVLKDLEDKLKKD